MAQQRPRLLFFTGTDTDVGKTYVAALALRELRHSGLRVAAYKPVASGCEPPSLSTHQTDAITPPGHDSLVSQDAVELWEASARQGTLEAVCPQRFRAPLAPFLAAAQEGRSVDEPLMVAGLDSLIESAQQESHSVDGGQVAGSTRSFLDLVVVEGAGGLMSPLSENFLNSDLAKRLDAHVVVVAANRLGAIHQVLATVTAASALRLPMVGIVLNQVTANSDLSVPQNAEIISRFTDIPVLGQVAFGASSSGIDWANLPTPKLVSTPIVKAWL